MEMVCRNIADLPHWILKGHYWILRGGLLYTKGMSILRNEVKNGEKISLNLSYIPVENPLGTASIYGMTACSGTAGYGTRPELWLCRIAALSSRSAFRSISSLLIRPFFTGEPLTHLLLDVSSLSGEASARVTASATSCSCLYVSTNSESIDSNGRFLVSTVLNYNLFFRTRNLIDILWKMKGNQLCRAKQRHRPKWLQLPALKTDHWSPSRRGLNLLPGEISFSLIK